MIARTLFLSIILFVFFFSNLSAQVKHAVTLTGQNEVPRVLTPALGYLAVWVESDSLYMSGEFSNLKDYYLSGYIYYGEKGKNGNQIFPLHPDLSEDHKSASFDPEENTFHLSPSLRQALKEGNLYISIASYTHRQGEIRGQIPRF